MPPTSLSEIDEALVRYADSMSPEAISFKIKGELTPAQVRSRLSALLSAPDWLTSTQEDQLITLKMRQLVVKFEEMPLTARTGEILLRALESVGARLEKRAEATEKDLSQLYAFQGGVMLDAVNASMDHMHETLVNKQKVLTEAEWIGLTEGAMLHAQLELSKHE